MNTVKVLVGLSETGTVTFVSETYGASTFDRQVFERSGLLQKLEANDVVLADTGFNVQDLLLRRNVRLYIIETVALRVTLSKTLCGKSVISHLATVRPVAHVTIMRTVLKINQSVDWNVLSGKHGMNAVVF